MSSDINKPAISTTVTGSNNEPKDVEIKVNRKEGGIAQTEVVPVNRKQPFAGSHMTIRDAYENSAWFRHFFFEILEMYGYPVSSMECETQQEKIMFSWAMLNLTSALTKERGLWYTLFDIDDPVMTADFFCRTYFERRKKHAIPPMSTDGPLFIPHDSEKKSKNENEK